MKVETKYSEAKEEWPNIVKVAAITVPIAWYVSKLACGRQLSNNPN